MKKISYLVVFILVIALLLAACAREEEETSPTEQEIKAGMVTDVGGLGDQSFNDAAYRGLKKAEEDFNVKINVIESNLASDYIPNLSNLAEQDYDIIFAIGVLMQDALDNVAQQFPETKFSVIDAVVDKPNVASVTFEEQDGSYLMGIIAARMTKTNVVGFIGGMELPLIEKFESGYRAGIKEINPDIRVLIAYTGAFDDPGRGKELALTQFQQDADIIYHASGACGVGVIKAAQEKGEGYYAIGVDSPQYHLAPDNVITSMVKGVDIGIYDIIKMVKDNKFKAEHYVLGFEENAIGASEHLQEMAPESLVQEVNEYKEKIIRGEIKVPISREAF